MTKPAVLITGASSGIGETYADRLAHRGHDLVLVARSTAKLEQLADHLRKDAGVTVDLIPADLTDAAACATVEARLREDARIGILVNNAGATLGGSVLDQTADALTALLALNVTAVVRLAAAAAPRLAAQGSGAIVNIGSVVGFAPEFGMTVYGATKAFVLHLSQGLARELGPKGVYVQAVLPAATRTNIWGSAGLMPANLPPMMDVTDLVDAALAGFDRREPVTIPPLHDEAAYTAFDAARQAMLQGFGATTPAPRYTA